MAQFTNTNTNNNKSCGNLRALDNKQLHEKLLILAADERRVTVEVIRHLREVEDRRLHLERGHSSLVSYCVKELGYSESSAMRRISAVRLSREVPEIETKVEAGVLTLSNVATAQMLFRAEEKKSSMTIEQKRELLVAIENTSTREAERKIFEKLPNATRDFPVREERRVSCDRTKIEMLLANDELREVEVLKNQLSHIDPNFTHRDLYLFLVRKFLKNRGGERAADKKSAGKTVGDKTVIDIKPIGSAQPASVGNGRYISAAVRREVWQRDGGVCTYRDPVTKQKCGSRHQLQIDHEIPFACGGESVTENLRLLCRAHNIFEAERAFGRKKMSCFS